MLKNATDHPYSLVIWILKKTKEIIVTRVVQLQIWKEMVQGYEVSAQKQNVPLIF